MINKKDLKTLTQLLLVIGSMCYCIPTLAQDDANNIKLRVVSPPSVFTVNGFPACYYELHLLNASDEPVDILRLQIENEKGITLLMKDGDDLRKQLSRVAGNRDSSRTIEARDSVVIYMELYSPSLTQKTELQHSVSVRFSSSERQKLQSILFTMRLMNSKAVSIGSPLADGLWTAVYDPSWRSGHRRVFYSIDGKARIPGRHAIDFIKMDQEGRYTNGDEDTITNWFGYGADVLAVADGIVTTVKSHFQESATLSKHPVYTPDKSTGNYVSLKINDSVFAFYEHLKPGSIEVKSGQKVKKGEKIAALGFTGQTTGPHLHFHLANSDSPLGADGIPFVFERFNMIGAYTDFDDFGKKKWRINLSREGVRTNECPESNSVISF